MTAGQYTPGRFVWRELLTKDVPKAKGFYGELFGWTFKDAPMPGMTYTLVNRGEKQIGGLFHFDVPNMPSAWVSYLSVTDVDAAAKTALAAGGKIFKEPTDIPNVGRFATVADPTGAVFNLYRDAKGDAPAATPAGYEFCWETLVTTDITAAKTFYEKLSGWKTATGPGSDTPIFTRDTTPQGMVADLQKAPANVPSHWCTYVVVEKLETSRDRAAKLGGSVIVPLIDVPSYGRISIVKDPTGAIIGLFEASNRPS